MNYETLSCDLAEKILTVTLNRPDKLNAFTVTMANELIDVFTTASDHDEVRAIIVTGAGRAFCAGMDLAVSGNVFGLDESQHPTMKDMNERLEDPAIVKGVRDTGGRVSLSIFNCKKPVIGAINGAAVGVGVTMQLPMDIRLASTEARFGFVFARRGIVPEAASTWFLSRVVGMQTALEWCFTGRVFNAQEALERGLVRSVHAPADLLEAAQGLAREMTRHSAPVSVALTRQLLWRMAGTAHPMDAHCLDSRAIQSRGQAQDVREGVGAFLEKREAIWPDRVSTDLPGFFDWRGEPPFA